MITFTEGPRKSSTLEIFQECLLCYDQLQQRSGDANVLVCRLVFSRVIVFFFSQHNNIPEIFRCSWFSRFDCKLAWDQAPHCGEKGKNRLWRKKKTALGLLRSPIFFLFWPRFLPFSPNADLGFRLTVIRDLLYPSWGADDLAILSRNRPRFLRGKRQ